MRFDGLSDGFLWVICGLGVLLVLAVALGVWSAARVAGQDDQQLEQTKPRRVRLTAAERRELRKTDRL